MKTIGIMVMALLLMAGGGAVAGEAELQKQIDDLKYRVLPLEYQEVDRQIEATQQLFEQLRRDTEAAQTKIKNLKALKEAKAREILRQKDKPAKRTKRVEPEPPAEIEDQN